MIATATGWESMRTAETRMVEDALKGVGFERVDAYRYNSASIRLRVIDARFEGLRVEQRDALVDPHLAKLPEATEADIMSLLTFAPSELRPAPRPSRSWVQNLEFEDPSPSEL